MVGTIVLFSLNGHLDFEICSVETVVAVVILFSLQAWSFLWLALMFCLTCKLGGHFDLIVVLFSLYAR